MQENDNKCEVVNKAKYRYSSSWIHTLESEEHWSLYWFQQKIMEGKVFLGQNVLEIGVGSGFTSNYLRSKGINVTTIDIDADKKPDIIANIVTYNFQKNYDHVLAFEVFEHIPFEEFKKLARKLSFICNGLLFLSVPRNERVWFSFSLKMPIIGRRYFEFTTKINRIKEENYHFWEIDYKGITIHKFEHIVCLSGFQLIHNEKKHSRLFYVFRSAINHKKLG